MIKVCKRSLEQNAVGISRVVISEYKFFSDDDVAGVQDYADRNKDANLVFERL